jgi:hypothetical protein
MSFPLPFLTLLHWVRPGIKDAGMRGHNISGDGFS